MIVFADFRNNNYKQKIFCQVFFLINEKGGLNMKRLIVIILKISTIVYLYYI